MVGLDVGQGESRGANASCRIPVAPLAFPHCTTADDVYADYLIPKGSMFFPNVW